jgi:hypothetical protein
MDDVDGERLRVLGEEKKTMETGGRERERERERETLVQKLRSMKKGEEAPEV